MAVNRRRAGARWRVLVHEMEGRQRSGISHHVAHDATFGGGDGQDDEWSRHHVLPGTEFDELVVGSWLHIEQMDVGTYWADVAGVTLWIRADRDGKPTSITVYGPNDYGDPVDGVAYALEWTDAALAREEYEQIELPPTKESADAAQGPATSAGPASQAAPATRLPEGQPHGR